MTLGAILDVPGFPTIISDMLATENGQVITPSNITFEVAQNTDPKHWNSILTRKILTARKDRLVTFAGEADQAKDLADVFKPILNQDISADKIANHISQEYWTFLEKRHVPNSSGEIQGPSFLAAVRENNRVFIFGSAKNDEGRTSDARHIETAIFGKCAAIGTGADDFLNDVREFEKPLSEDAVSTFGYQTLIVRLMNLHISRKLFLDVGRQDTKDTWGGMLDYRIFGFKNGIGSDPNQMFLSYIIDWDRASVSWEILPKAIWLDPHNAGRVLTMYLRDPHSGNFKKFEMPIEEIIEPIHIPPEQIGSSDCPDSVHILFQHRMNGREVDTHYDMTPSEMEEFRAEFQTSPADFDRHQSLRSLLVQVTQSESLRKMVQEAP